jgi:hypothetical protein
MAYTRVEIMVSRVAMMSVSERTVVVMVMESIAVVPIPVM